MSAVIAPAPLTQDGTGDCGAQLTCRYHGWRYKLDGRLAAARDFGPAEGFDPRNFSLFPLSVQTWRGFIFANMEKEPEPFSKTMAPLEEAMRTMDVERFTVPHLSDARHRLQLEDLCRELSRGLSHPGAAPLAQRLDRHHLRARPQAAGDVSTAPRR